MKTIPQEELPDDIREKDCKSNSNLDTMEQETSFSFSKDVDHVHMYTDIPTFMKWIFSIEETEILFVHMDEDDDAVIGCKAKIPKNYLKLQSSGRKNASHFSMVSYGDARN